MNKDTIQLEAFIHSVSTLVDGGLKLNIHTQELPAETMMSLMKIGRKMGYIAISPEAMRSIEMPKAEVEFKGDKTPSQRLRNTLYVYWEKKELSEDFDSFYKRKIEEFIDVIKEKIE